MRRQTFKTRLLCSLQAQTLPDATSPIGKIHPFSKITVTLEPVITKVFVEQPLAFFGSANNTALLEAGQLAGEHLDGSFPPRPWHYVAKQESH